MAKESAMLKSLRSLTLQEKNLESSDEELGRGAYGRVFKVKYCGQPFAAKEIHSILLESASKKQKEPIIKSFLRECQYCVNLRHPNIVQFIGVYWPNQRSDLPVMVMELMDCTLKKFIMENQPETDIKLTHKYSILRDVALGLAYLHAQTPPVIHRDLSPNNVLLTERGVAKIGDLGVARAIQGSGKMMKNLKLTKAPGTTDFMPPEALSNKPVYDTSLDIFSFGGIALFVISEQWPEPTAATEVDILTHRVVGFTEIQRRQKYLNTMDEDNQELRKLVEKCLDNDPSSRPTIGAALEKIESLQAKLAEVRVKPPPLPPPVSPRPKPRHISVPSGPLSALPNSATPRLFSLLSPVHSSNDHYRSMPHSLDISPVKERRKMRVSLTLGEALRDDKYQINWTRCANLPVPMYGASVTVGDQHVYISAGVAPEYDVYREIFCYDILSDRWSRLPPPDHSLGILCMVDGKLNLFGGNNSNYTATNKVSTFDSDANKWITHFPAMLKSRIKPGVTVYLEHIIVVGGAKNITTFHDDIEILNWQQSPFEWQIVDIILPVPMWTISLTMSSDKLLIVGYTQAKGRSTSTYQLPVNILLEPRLYSNQLQDSTWVKLHSAPHHDTALVPWSNPPVIIGGSSRGHPTLDISVYSASENSWQKCASLPSPRINVAVASIYDDTIMVFGGYTSGTNVEAAMVSSLTTVEMGRVEEADDEDYLNFVDS